MDASDFNQLPVCTCCDLHGADRSQDLKYGLIALVPFPVGAGTLDQILKLLTDWSKGIGAANVSHVVLEEGASVRH